MLHTQDIHMSLHFVGILLSVCIFSNSRASLAIRIAVNTTSDVIMNNVNCQDGVGNLGHCSYEGLGLTACKSKMLAGVICGK